MKILLIHNKYKYRGGEEVYIENLISLLKKEGHIVITYFKDSRDIKLFTDKLKIAFGLFWNPIINKELTRLIKYNKPDIAHFNNIYPLIGATAYIVCINNKIPIVQHIHNYRFMCAKGFLFRNGKVCELCVDSKISFFSVIYGCYHNSRLASLFFNIASFFHNILGTFRLIDKFVFPSEFTKKYYIRKIDLPKNKVIVIPYFINTMMKRIALMEKKDYFLFVGRLSEEKGIIQLLKIFKTLQKQKLVVIRDGPLRKEVEKYNINNISIVGNLPRHTVLKYIKKSIAVIISSNWYEVLPYVYLEAIKEKTTIVVPNNDNFKILPKKNSKIIMYKFLDFGNLKEKIIQIYRSRNKYRLLPVKSLFQNPYTPAYHYKHLIFLYRKLVRSS